jgi:ribonuclease HI
MPDLPEDHIELYADGAASGNPGPGGYGIVLKYRDHRKEASGGFRLTTNNRMELMAVIRGLEMIKVPDLQVRIYSDSQYLVNAINERWIFAWKKSGFSKKANADLWRRFLGLYNPSLHTFIWVKGHADNKENNRCDLLAVQAYKKGELHIDEAYEAIGKKGFFSE